MGIHIFRHTHALMMNRQRPTKISIALWTTGPQPHEPAYRVVMNLHNPLMAMRFP